MKHLFTGLLCCICFLNLRAQSFFDNVHISVGFAAQAQDRRSLNLDGRTFTPQGEDSRVDVEYNAVLHKPVLTFQRLDLTVGLGYAHWRSTFSRPFNFGEILRLTFGGYQGQYVGNYNLHKIVLPVTTRFYMDRKKIFNVQISTLPSIALHRRVTEHSINNNTYIRWEFSPYSLEINPGIGMKVGKNFEVNLNYRAYNLVELDRIIFDDMTRNIDTYNPVKLWLSFFWLI